mgnify:FL=1
MNRILTVSVVAKMPPSAAFLPIAVHALRELANDLEIKQKAGEDWALGRTVGRMPVPVRTEKDEAGADRPVFQTYGLAWKAEKEEGDGAQARRIGSDNPVAA